jgi:hypothetical protein
MNFNPTPDNARRLTKLAELTGLDSATLINLLLEAPLEQMIDEGDSDYLRSVLYQLRFPTKEAAAEVISRYEDFCTTIGACCYQASAAPMRDFCDGSWRLSFRSKNPEDAGARYE